MIGRREKPAGWLRSVGLHSEESPTLANEGVMQTTQTHVERALDLKIINTFFFFFFQKVCYINMTMVLSFHLLEHCVFFFNIHLFPDDMELNH